ERQDTTPLSIDNILSGVSSPTSAEKVPTPAAPAPSATPIDKTLSGITSLNFQFAPQLRPRPVASLTTDSPVP
ncbi:hypothetical protein HK102_006529, partial [Quaeritorhiza haematococci]